MLYKLVFYTFLGNYTSCCIRARKVQSEAAAGRINKIPGIVFYIQLTMLITDFFYLKYN